MSNYRRVRIPGASYFFTVVTHRRQAILCNRGVPRLLLDTMNQVREELPFSLEALVIMPDHLHSLWSLPETSSDYSKRWALIKLRFTKLMATRVDCSHVTSPARAARHDGSIWQRRFWEHMIRDPADFNVHFHYIHFNPVKHGLVTRVADWPFSTFHRFLKTGVYSRDWGGLEVWPDNVGSE